MIGQPLIAAWPVDSTLFKVYQLHPTDGFIEVASYTYNPGTTVSIDQRCKLIKWVNNSQGILTFFRNASNAWGMQIRHPTNGAMINSLNVLNADNDVVITESFDKDAYVGFIRVNNKSLIIDHLADAGDVTINATLASGDSATDTNLKSLNWSYPGTQRTITYHPDKTVLFIGGSVGGYVTTAVVNDTTNLYTINGIRVGRYAPTGSAPALQTNVQGDIAWASWSPDGLYLYMVTTTDDVAVYRYDATEPNTALRLTRMTHVGLAGTFVTAEFRPDNKYLAISYTTGGVYYTVIFSRKGFALQTFQTITGMGQQLSYTADSKYLIDLCAKRMYSWSESLQTFVDNPSLLTNIGDGIQRQGINDYTPFPTLLPGKIYRISHNDIVEETIDVDNLKFTLLTSSASFDPDEATLNPLTYQVSGAWPNGGVSLQNVAFGYVDTTGNYGLKADALSIELSASVTVRYGFLYDSNLSKPIAFYDFGSDVVTEGTISFQLDTSSMGIVAYSV